MTNEVFTMVLPYAPSVNRIWRRGKSATYKDRKAVDFNQAALAERFNQRADDSLIFEEGPGLAVRMTMHPRRPKKWTEGQPVRRQDIDAPVKIVLDSLQFARVFNDDKQVVSLHVDIGAPVPDGALTVSVWRFTEVAK